MTNAEKKLLLIDLCSRLPYGVKGLHRGKVHELFTIDGRVVSNACIQVDGYDAWFPIDTGIEEGGVGTGKDDLICKTLGFSPPLLFLIGPAVFLPCTPQMFVLCFQDRSL